MNRKARCFILLLILAPWLWGGLRLAWAAIDRVPNNTTGAIYKASPSVLSDGEYDSLHTDVNHGLLVDVIAGGGTSPPSSGTSPNSAALPFHKTSSNGATPVVLVAGSGSKVIIPTSLTIDNEDTVVHTIDVLTSTGSVSIWHFQLQANTGAIYDGAAAYFSLRTLPGDSLELVIDGGGTGSSCNAIGYTIKQ